MAGRSGNFKEMMDSLRTDVYQFELILEKEKEWKLTSAQWQQASVEDIGTLLGNLDPSSEE